MRAHDYGQVTPRRDHTLRESAVFDFTSGYVQRALSQLPKRGNRAPWRLCQNYVKDLLSLRHGRDKRSGAGVSFRITPSRPPAEPVVVLMSRLPLAPRGVSLHTPTTPIDVLGRSGISLRRFERQAVFF